MGRDAQMKRTRSQIEGDEGGPSRTGSIRPMKKKFSGNKAHKLAKQVWKGRSDNARNGPQDELEAVPPWRSSGECEIITNGGNGRASSSSSSLTMMPEKHVLELVLDTLQRRDTYELFAEPVNPDEVEDYYEIVKEPMDFGTMRAKLHEGMYQNLQQFQHDVFLIPENAMNFNASTTPYFRQARAIHELAKKVFHALKTDPENFELEFSGTRRQSMRKAMSEPKDSRLGTTGFSKETSTLRKRLNKTSTELPTTHLGVFPRNAFTANGNGNANGQLSIGSQEADRCFENRPLKLHPFNNEDTLHASTSFNAPKRLVLMNQGEMNYMDSLISFVKDLGQVAQMVARRKLLGVHESTHDSYPNSHRFPQKAAENVIDLTKHGAEANGGSNFPSTSNIGKKESVKVTGNNKIKRGPRDTVKASDDNVRPVILALENSHPKGGGEHKIRNKKSSTNTMLSLQKEAKKQAPVTSFVTAPASQFAFDLPFLKARLEQMNATAAARIALPHSR